MLYVIQHKFDWNYVTMYSYKILCVTHTPKFNMNRRSHEPRANSGFSGSSESLTFVKMNIYYPCFTYYCLCFTMGDFTITLLSVRCYLSSPQQLWASAEWDQLCRQQTLNCCQVYDSSWQRALSVEHNLVSVGRHTFTRHRYVSELGHTTVSRLLGYLHSNPTSPKFRPRI